MNVNTTSGGGAIRERRKARGLSQQALADRAGCSMSMVRLLEAGYMPATGSVAGRVLAALNDVGPAANRPDEKERDLTAHVRT